MLISSCPKCGGHFTWSDYSGKLTRMPAKCVNKEYFNPDMDPCDFECEAIRTTTGNIVYEWDGVSYWDIFYKSKQLKLFN